MSKQSEFELGGSAVSPTTLEKGKLITALLSKATSLSVVSEFLKSKNLPHSAGSWEDMLDTRIAPFLSRGKLTLPDLTRLLGEAEEFGRSHIFLYQGDRKQLAAHFTKDRISNLARKQGHASAFGDGLVVDLPTEPTVVEIRQETMAGRSFWVFKIVEARDETVPHEDRSEGDIIIKTWRIEKVRAVNVACLHESGFLEIRIQSHTNSSKYAEDVKRVWTLLKDYLPPTLFAPFSLAKAKKELWGKRATLKAKVRFNHSTMRNDFGTTIVASTRGDEDDLFKDKGAEASIDGFLGAGAHSESSNVWFRAVSGIIDRQIHVLLSGENNEFAVPANCTRKEHEYVLNELRIYSK